MTDYELLEIDRIAKIQSINKQYDLENNAYLSFSGGKDSTVLHYLLDLALPGNKIPRLFINTGIEYEYIVDFVKKLEQKDSRIQIVNSNVNIKKMLEIEGYPFKSKEHSLKIGEYQKSSRTKSVVRYKEMSGKSRYGCPKCLLYQFDHNFSLKLSDKCCYRLKKDIATNFAKENKKHILMTGMLAEEGGQRANINCIVTKKDKLVKFHPLLFCSTEWEDWFIKKYNIKLCKLYYPPFNFKRTGCKGCPYALDLQEELDVMGKYLPEEKRQCERIMYENIRIIEKLKPKYVIWENVKNLLSKKHIHNFNAYLEAMEQLGYNNFYQVLNSKDYGIPQNRERLFCVSVLGEYSSFCFPSPIQLQLKLKDMLDYEVDKKYYLTAEQVDRIKLSSYDQNKRRIQEKDYCDTLCAHDSIGPKCVKFGNSYRKLIPKECWRLMGFSDKDFEKAAKVNSDFQLYKQAGNSIVVNVLMAIFNNLLKGK